ncbi:AraC family transcriptional regulator [Sutcliffiella horikoshii]|uniref:AraC family transcriptional regulator n=1 Tax=Sutcliffiella horikoshii TaxID=79883 RepID=UPI001F48D003|nr:AraC family transcriptional regulator [Sutcliffiella horikoshii]
MLNEQRIDFYKAVRFNLREGQSEAFNEDCDYYYILYVSSGSGTLDSSGQVRRVEEGKSYFLTDACELTSAASDLLTVYYLSWPKEGDMISGFLSGRLAEQAPVKMMALWEELRKWNKGKTISARCRFQSLLWEMLSVLTDDAEVDRMEEAADLLRNNLSKPLTVAELASKMNMSPVSFSRAFRKRTGMTPKEFLNVERMKAAKTLMLQKKGITAKEVALQIGLQDEFYFSRLFKNKEGLPPSLFMKRAKERIAVVSQLFLQDHLLALGVQPVAAPSYPTMYPASSGVPSYLQQGLEGTKLLNAERPFQPEDILLAQPDRIIKTPLHNHQLQNVLLSHQERVHHMPFKQDWREYLFEIASMVGCESRAESIDKEIHCLECNVRDEMCPLTQKGNWAVIWIRPEEIRLYGQENHALLDLLFQSLGFQPHPDLHGEGYRIVSLKDIAALNPDKLLILWSHERDVWRMAHTPDWNKIRAVQSGEVYYPESHEWDPWGPLGRKKMLEEFSSSMFKAKLKA